MIFRIITTLLLLIGLPCWLPADSIPTHISKQTFEFAQKDTGILKMDVYRAKGTEQDKQPVMIFIFGGSFKRGNRDAAIYNNYFFTLPTQGITTVSIDYRLGLVDRKLKLFDTSAADDAINMAVEDLFSATLYLLENAEQLGIDPECIMVSGSSAGAVTSLQADYYLSNRMPLSEMLPEDFRYKGVVAFAGAIFSHKGTPDYKAAAPAPTMFMHGNKDRVVFYNRLRLFRRGLFGSKSLAKRFKKRGFDYLFITMEEKGHSVAVTPMKENLDMVQWFIETYVYEGKNWQIDSFLNDGGE